MRERNVRISPSLMCADFLHLQEEIDLLEAFGVEYLHIDIMDGHYVPNFTLGPGFCSQLAQATSIPLDIHLMIDPVDPYVPQFAAFPNAIVTFHPEGSRHPLRTIDYIRTFGARPGIAVDPSISLDSLKHMLPAVDFVCLMTVNPGYSGQSLVPGALEKISEFAEWRETTGHPLEIEIDGNVSWENIPKMIAAGADTLVVGTSSIFGPVERRKQDIDRLAELVSANGA